MVTPPLGSSVLDRLRERLACSTRRRFMTGLLPLDGVSGWDCGAVHELLYERRSPCPLSVGLLLARSAAGQGRAIVWMDEQETLNPPAVVQAGVSAARLLVLRPRGRRDALWALCEALACPAVGAVLARGAAWDLRTARRVQLAAERGGSVAILTRRGDQAACYAAASRWRIEPHPGEAAWRRWRMRCVHGHGRPTDQDLIVEFSRDGRVVRASEELADRSGAPASARVSA